ncbi:hypothetical protein AAG570_012051 [Ranatra chinensis]|uniref:Uncharacterized protein n=1 Tax=Ranatra chinensis TaxID=642074 RepID=A0ABD0YHV7_9HEMI
MASKRRNIFYQNKKQESTEIGEREAAVPPLPVLPGKCLRSEPAPPLCALPPSPRGHQVRAVGCFDARIASDMSGERRSAFPFIRRGPSVRNKRQNRYLPSRLSSAAFLLGC